MLKQYHIQYRSIPSVLLISIKIHDKSEHPVKSSTLVRPVSSSNFMLPDNICTVDSNKPLCPVSSSKPVHPVDVCKPIPSVNSNKIVRTVDSNKPVNSKIVHPVNIRKPVRLVNSRKPVLPIDVRKAVPLVNSHKPVYPVEVCKSGVPVDIRKPVCLLGICKPFFVDNWRHVTLFFILLFFAVSKNTSVFNRTILYMILFINIHLTYLIFTNFFKCTFVLLIGYFLYIGDRLFKYLFLRNSIICQHFLKIIVNYICYEFCFC